MSNDQYTSGAAFRQQSGQRRVATMDRNRIRKFRQEQEDRQMEEEKNQLVDKYLLFYLVPSAPQVLTENSEKIYQLLNLITKHVDSQLKFRVSSFSLSKLLSDSDQFLVDKTCNIVDLYTLLPIYESNELTYWQSEQDKKQYRVSEPSVEDRVQTSRDFMELQLLLGYIPINTQENGKFMRRSDLSNVYNWNASINGLISWVDSCAGVSQWPISNNKQYMELLVEEFIAHQITDVIAIYDPKDKSIDPNYWDKLHTEGSDVGSDAGINTGRDTGSDTAIVAPLESKSYITDKLYNIYDKAKSIFSKTKEDSDDDQTIDTKSDDDYVSIFDKDNLMNKNTETNTDTPTVNIITQIISMHGYKVRVHHVRGWEHDDAPNNNNNNNNIVQNIEDSDQHWEENHEKYADGSPNYNEKLPKKNISEQDINKLIQIVNDSTQSSKTVLFSTYGRGRAMVLFCIWAARAIMIRTNGYMNWTKFWIWARVLRHGAVHSSKQMLYIIQNTEAWWKRTRNDKTKKHVTFNI
jgi:hypothetical protein